LIRHGETAWSLSGRHTGHTDIPLTRHGEAMARELAPLLGPVPFTQILTSPRRRARTTCGLALIGRQAIIEPELVEWDYGKYEGMDTVHIQTVNPGWSVFRDGCPDGESLDDVVMRADRLLARLREQSGDIALFSHGQFSCVLAARWVHLGGSEAEHFALDPASLSILGPKPGHSRVPAILRWNVVPVARLDHQH
jgi:broad specificity phosphatase PhoE